MQEAGYNTYYAGKLMNGHMVETYNDPYPAAWNQTHCECLRLNFSRLFPGITMLAGSVMLTLCP